MSDGSSADFLPGGYVSNEFLFRADGILEVRRTFGEDEEISQTWRVGYEWNEDATVLTLGSDPKTRPSGVTLRGFTLGDAGISSPPATQKLPAELRRVRMENNRMQLGRKVYRLLKE